MAETDDAFVRTVALEAGRIITANATGVKYPDRYAQACTTKIIATEAERILRWRSEYDVRPVDMARAIVDGGPPRWWVGQRLTDTGPDATVIDLDAHRRERDA